MIRVEARFVGEGWVELVRFWSRAFAEGFAGGYVLGFQGGDEGRQLIGVRIVEDTTREGE